MYYYYKCVKTLLLKSEIIHHLGLIEYVKLKVKVSVYFVSNVFSFILNIETCSIKMKTDGLNLMHLTIRKKNAAVFSILAFLYFNFSG